MHNRVIDEDLDYIAKKFPSDRIHNANFLITGANGFLPSYLVYTLLHLNKKEERKFKIYALVRNKKNAEKKFKDYLNDKSLKIIEHDITKQFWIKDKIDYIIHGASQASPKFFNTDPVGTLLPNTIGTKNLLDLALKKKSKSFLLMSSGEVYGNIKKKILESNFGLVDPLDVHSCYAESKRMAETMCVAWHKQYGVSTKIARIFHTYGPGMLPDDGRVQADFVYDILNNRNIKLKSNGLAKRPFCYISDVSIACFLLLFHGENGHAYNVANPKNLIRIKDLAKLLISISNNKSLKIVRSKNKQTQNYLKSRIESQSPDIGKITKLGWSPYISINDGFVRTIRSYRKI